MIYPGGGRVLSYGFKDDVTSTNAAPRTRYTKGLSDIAEITASISVASLLALLILLNQVQNCLPVTHA